MYKENNQNWKFFIKNGFKESQLFEHVFSKKKSIKFQRDYKFPDTMLLLHNQQKRKFYDSKQFNSEEGIENFLNLQIQNLLIQIHLIENIYLNIGIKKLIIIISVKFCNKIWPILSNAYANIRVFGENYYQKLKLQNNVDKDMLNQIDKDLIRTEFPKSEQYKEQLYSILKCFCIRNCNINYIQGMNELGLFLLGTDFGEEITFWMLNFLFEQIYPYDYFQSISNVQNIDFYIVKKLMKISLKDQKEKYIFFQNYQEEFSQIFLKLFITIFTHKVSQNRILLMHIYHYIFLEGFFSIYKTIISLFKSFMDNVDTSILKENVDDLDNKFVEQFYIHVNTTTTKKSYKKYYKEIFLNYDLLWQIRKNRLNQIQNNNKQDTCSFIDISINNSEESSNYDKFFKQKTIQELLVQQGVLSFQNDTQMKNIQVDFHLEKTQDQDLSINNQISQKDFLIQEQNEDTDLKYTINQSLLNDKNNFTMNDSLSLIKKIDDSSLIYDNLEFLRQMENRKQMKRHKCFTKGISKDYLSHRQDHICQNIIEYEKDILLYKNDFFQFSKKLRHDFSKKLQEPIQGFVQNNSYYEENLNLSELNDLELNQKLQNCQSFISETQHKHEVHRKRSYNVQRNDAQEELQNRLPLNSNFSMLSNSYNKEQLN